MAVVEINRGGYAYKCITPSETPTWRMIWDSELIVQDLFESSEETLTLAINFAFEGSTKQECVDKATELGLYLDELIENKG